MKSITNYLNSMKSMYFMLLAYVTLLMGVASCSHGEFANYEPEKQQKYSKAELIEQALSRIPQTRAENPNAVIMVTIQDTIAFQCRATETMKVFVDGEEHPDPITETNKDCNHTFTNGFPSHSITIVGSKEAIRELDVDNNGLIMLNVSGNTNLTDLSCRDNHLDAIGWTNCPNLWGLYISNNEFNSVDITNLPALESFYADNNRLTTIKMSKEQKVYELYIQNNLLTELYLSDNQELYSLEVQNNPLKKLNLKNNTFLGYLNASFTQITDLDLSNDTNLWAIYLNNVPIKIINNQPLSDTSFSIFTELNHLSIAYTPFESLDLSNNPRVRYIDISGTAITKLNISDLPMRDLYATHSKLINLIYNDLSYLYCLRIERTPFEGDSLNMSSLASALPPRTESGPGHLYTYSPWINYFASDFERINWEINR